MKANALNREWSPLTSLECRGELCGMLIGREAGPVKMRGLGSTIERFIFVGPWKRND